MPNRHYINGIYKERKLVNKARGEGKIALRSAGSHSPIDVVIVDFENGLIKLIQCKPSKNFWKGKTKLEEQYKMLNGIYEVTFEVSDGT